MKVIQKQSFASTLWLHFIETKRWEKNSHEATTLCVYSQCKDVQRTAISQWQSVFNIHYIITAQSHNEIMLLNEPKASYMQIFSALVRFVSFCINKKKTTDRQTQWARLISHCEHIVHWTRARYGEVAPKSQLFSFTPFLQRQAAHENNMWWTLLVFKWGGSQDAE